MEQVTTFKTSDGELFESESKAASHEAELKFDAWYSENELQGNYAGSRVDLEDFKDYIRTNREWIEQFL